MGTASGMIHRVVTCRACGHDGFEDVINLGQQYVIDFPEKKDPDALKAPLVVIRCTKCTTVQLAHSVQKDRLYRKFWYRSGISEQMRQALDEIVRRACSAVELNSGDRVLDIGANDGTLLQMYPQHVTTVAVDPASELINEAMEQQRVDVGIPDYFSREAVQRYGPYKVITAIAMFYDLEDPVQFLEDCRDVMEKDGVLIIQMNYLVSMLQNLSVDNISHEHLMYLSVTALQRMVEVAGMEIAGAETNDVNGGSVRVYITHRGVSLVGMSADKQVELYGKLVALIQQERKMDLDTDNPYWVFRNRVQKVKEMLASYLAVQKTKGAKLYLYGASTRGATLFQMLGLPYEWFEAAAERDEKKWGRLTGGTWVPIVSEVEARAAATHFLVLPYHFWETIKRRETLWLENGGTFIVPLPQPKVVKQKGEFLLRSGAPKEEVLQ